MLGWEESLRQQVACRNDKESVPFRGLVQEHGDLQVECRELRVLVEKLKRENEKYGKENELLLHDTQAGKGGKYVHASAPRVKSLEAEVALLRTDADDFRRSQQRVITRYDDDLTQTKQLLEKSEAKCKNLEEDKSEYAKKDGERGEKSEGAPLRVEDGFASKKWCQKNKKYSDEFFSG